MKNAEHLKLKEVPVELRLELYKEVLDGLTHNLNFSDNYGHGLCLSLRNIFFGCTFDEALSFFNNSYESLCSIIPYNKTKILFPELTNKRIAYITEVNDFSPNFKRIRVLNTMIKEVKQKIKSK